MSLRLGSIAAPGGGIRLGSIVFQGLTNKLGTDSGILSAIEISAITSGDIKHGSDLGSFASTGDQATEKILLELFDSAILSAIELHLTGIGVSDSGAFTSTESGSVNTGEVVKSDDDTGIISSVEQAALLTSSFEQKVGNDSAVLNSIETALFLNLDVSLFLTDAGSILSTGDSRTLFKTGLILKSATDSSEIIAIESSLATLIKSALDEAGALTSLETAILVQVPYDLGWEDNDVTWGGLQLSSKSFSPIYISGNRFFVLGENNDLALNAFLERRAVIHARGRPLLGTYVYPHITGPQGAVVKISLGAHDSPEGAITYEGPYDFVIGEDVSVDFAVAGNYIAIRFESEDSPVWKLQSYDIDWTLVGEH